MQPTRSRRQRRPRPKKSSPESKTENREEDAGHREKTYIHYFLFIYFLERKERGTEKEVCAKCYCRDEGKDPPGGGGSQPRVTSSETASKLGIHTAGPPWGPRETNETREEIWEVQILSGCILAGSLLPGPKSGLKCPVTSLLSGNNSRCLVFFFEKIALFCFSAVQRRI